MLIFNFLICFAFTAGAFEKEIIYVGGHKLNVEVALTEKDHEQGLMFRKHLAPNTGMLFVFDQAMPQSFWMKNTLIPLSIGYFGVDQKLNEVLDMDPASPMDMNPKIYSSSSPAKYALEVAQGWFKKNKIKLGDKLKRGAGLKSEQPRQRERTGRPKQYKGL